MVNRHRARERLAPRLPPAVEIDRSITPLAHQLEDIRHRFFQWDELTSRDAIRIVSALYKGRHPEQGVTMEAARELASIIEIRNAVLNRIFELATPVSSRQSNGVSLSQRRISDGAENATKRTPPGPGVQYGPNALREEDPVTLMHQASAQHGDANGKTVTPSSTVQSPPADAEQSPVSADVLPLDTTDSVSEIMAVLGQLETDAVYMQGNITEARDTLTQHLKSREELLKRQQRIIAEQQEQIAHLQETITSLQGQIQGSMQRALVTNEQPQKEVREHPSEEANPVIGMSPGDAIEFMLDHSSIISRSTFEQRRSNRFPREVHEQLQKEVVRIVRILRTVDGAEELFLLTYKIDPKALQRYERVYSETPRRIFTEPIIRRKSEFTPPEPHSNIPLHAGTSPQEVEKLKLPTPDQVQKTIPDAVSPDVEMIHPILTMEERIAAFSLPPIVEGKHRRLSLEQKREFVAIYEHLITKGPRGAATTFAMRHQMLPVQMKRLKKDITNSISVAPHGEIDVKKAPSAGRNIDDLMQALDASIPPLVKGERRNFTNRQREDILSLCNAMRQAKDHRLSAFLVRHNLVATESHWRRQLGDSAEDKGNKKQADRKIPVARRTRAGDHGPLPVHGFPSGSPIQMPKSKTEEEVVQWEAMQQDGRTRRDRICIITEALALKDNPDARDAFYQAQGVNAATVTGWFNVYRDRIPQVKEEARAPKRPTRTIPSPATPSFAHRRVERRHNANSAQQKPQENPQLVILDHLKALIQIPVLTAADINKRLTEIQTTPGDVFGPLQIAQRAYLQTISPLLREEQAEFEQLQSTHYGHRTKVQKERWNQLVRKHKQLLNLEVQLDKIAEVFVGILQKPHHARERYEEGALPELIQRLWKKLLVDIEDAIDLYNLEQED